LNKLNIRKFL